MANAEQLERRANRARERLAEHLNDLQYHTSPRLVVGSPRMVVRDLLGADIPRTAGDIASVLSQQVRRNPLAVALIAAGVGWLIYSDAKARSLAQRPSPSAVRRPRTNKTSKRRSPSRSAASRRPKIPPTKTE